MKHRPLIISIVIGLVIGTSGLLGFDREEIHRPTTHHQVVELQHPIYMVGDPTPVNDPVPQRGEQFNLWLAPSVRIAVTGARGSGTICYYDGTKKTAYVISCGHLWQQGRMSAKEGLERNITCSIDVFYHNEKKLSSPKTYPAKVVLYSHTDAADYSLLTFTPDWEPTYAPIAPKNYNIPNGSHQHSCGCDHASECANYDVIIDGMRGNKLITHNNSPRPGRSGGGLLTEDGYDIGICVQTTDTNGNGQGLFTPLIVIHEGFAKEGYNFLLVLKPVGNTVARRLPIIDRTEPQKEYPKEYILLPGIK